MTGQLSVDIRTGYLTRDEAMAVCKGNEGFFPWVYADVPVEELLDFIHMSEHDLFYHMALHTNRELFGPLTKERLPLKEWVVEC